MEIHTISSLLANQSTRTYEGFISHYEDIKNVYDENHKLLEIVALAITFNGVTNMGTCILEIPGDFKDKDSYNESIEAFKRELKHVWKEASLYRVQFSVPPADAIFVWPIVCPAPVKNDIQ